MGEGVRKPAEIPTGPRPLRILVIDDDPDSADTLSLLLSLDGHEVRCSYAGAPALQIAQSCCPEVIFSDLSMPGIDGLEVARRIRSDRATCATCLIALTGNGQVDDRRHSLAAGFDHHLTKPADFDAIRQLLGSL
jgi:CheY-like chemotaxis protein